MRMWGGWRWMNRSEKRRKIKHPASELQTHLINPNPFPRLSTHSPTSPPSHSLLIHSPVHSPSHPFTHLWSGDDESDEGLIIGTCSWHALEEPLCEVCIWVRQILDCGGFGDFWWFWGFFRVFVVVLRVLWWCESFTLFWHDFKILEVIVIVLEIFLVRWGFLWWFFFIAFSSFEHSHISIQPSFQLSISTPTNPTHQNHFTQSSQNSLKPQTSQTHW